MSNPQKRGEQRSCNCRNSKCMKLYCDCFSARVPCGKSCHCVDCQNTSVRDLFRQSYMTDKRLTREQLIRSHKGCACRRSGCTKKYCDCFQSGILCKESCKCVDCQNNESLTNRKVINQLRRNNSDISNPDNSISLYPLYLSQNSEHLHSIIAGSNPLSLEENWLDTCAKMLYESARCGSAGMVMDKLIQILSQLEQNITKQQQIGFQQQDFSEGLDEEGSNNQQGSPRKRVKPNQQQDEQKVILKQQGIQQQQLNKKLLNQEGKNDFRPQQKEIKIKLKAEPKIQHPRIEQIAMDEQVLNSGKTPQKVIKQQQEEQK